MTRRPAARLAALVSLIAGLVVATPARGASYLDDWHPYQTYWAVGWNVAVPLGSFRTDWQTTPAGWAAASTSASVWLAASPLA